MAEPPFPNVMAGRAHSPSFFQKNKKASLQISVAAFDPGRRRLSLVSYEKRYPSGDAGTWTEAKASRSHVCLILVPNEIGLDRRRA
jgi:hypothetical protein